MKDKKSVKLLIVALMLAVMLFLPTVLAATDDNGTFTDEGTETILGDEVLPYYIHLAEDGGIHYKITSDRPIDVYLMDSEDYDAFTSGRPYYFEHRQLDLTYAEYTTNEPAGDYYILIQSNGTYTSTVNYYIEFGPDVGNDLGDLFNGGLFGLLAGSMCLLLFIPFIIDLIIGYWMSKDAKRRGKSGAAWFVIGFFFNILGLIIWLLVRPPLQPAAPYGQPQYQQPYQAPPQQQYYQQQPPPQPQQPYQPPPQDDPYRKY